MRTPTPARTNWLAGLQILLLAGALAGAALSSTDEQWHSPALVVALLFLVVAADQLPIEMHNVRVSGGFLFSVVAMVLLGPAPAVAISVVTILVDSALRRVERRILLFNVATFATFPLVGGVLAEAGRHAAGLSERSASFLAVVFGIFVATNLLNFLLIAAFKAPIDGNSVRRRLREVYIPVLPSELLTAPLAVATIYLYARLGLAVLAGLAVVFAGFYYLTRLVRLAQTRAEQLTRQSELVAHQARTDDLTGLHNRRRLIEDLECFFSARAGAEARLLALFDLDGFKAYNDAYGHAAGDALLARLGRNLQQALEGRGGAYRLGGDEFCALVSDDDEAAVHAAAQALSEDGDRLRIGCSYGVARLPDDAQDASAALREADQRMYTSKGSRPQSAKRQARDLLLTVLHEQQPDLHDHTDHVAALANAVGRRLGMSDPELDDLARAAELHDVGKLAIPEAILRKPGPLDPDEWRLMRLHTLIGERMLHAVPALRRAAQMVRASHEAFDGSGYPDGLAGDAIPLGARIIVVCDAFDAMTSDRAYRSAISTADALAELRRCAGRHFDPAVCAVVEEEVARRGASPTERSASLAAASLA